MTQAEVEAFVAELENVQRVENFGYAFFFVGDDHRLPFVTIANSDNDWDSVSNLNREGVFRVNIGISKETFKNLIVKSDDELVDYSMLNTFLPHPEYAQQNFVCILNPSGENVETTKKLIAEAHSIAAKRLQRFESTEPMNIEFNDKIWFWRGPSPWYFVTVPAKQCHELKAILKFVTYGWGMIPVHVQIGKTEYKTSLWPKDGAYIVPIKASVRKAEKIDEGDKVTVRLQVAL